MGTKNAPGDVVCGGGGVRNARLWAELLKIFDPIPVRTMDECGSSSQAFEAQAFAVLAYQTDSRGLCQCASCHWCQTFSDIRVRHARYSWPFAKKLGMHDPDFILSRIK